MSFIGASKVGTYPFSQLASSQQPIMFDDIAFGVDPFGLDGIEPGAFGRQKQGQNAYTFALLLDQTVVLSYPGPHDLAHMEGGVIPDQQPRGFANRLQVSATPLQKLGGDGAYWTSCDEAQRHLLANRISRRTLLPKHPVTGQRFGIRITFLPGLFHQAHRRLCILPGMQARKREAAPPYLIQKPNCPAWLCARPGDQAVACRFFLK